LEEHGMAGPTRGFLGRRRERDPRLPPGQYDAGRDWPVLTAEPTPRIPPETWRVTVDGRVENPTTWTWEEAHRLPRSEYRGDISCVTT
jgi:DMSO/TMAO reductase YedYZ molybdopterin-dependent catalytic subunit